MKLKIFFSVFLCLLVILYFGSKLSAEFSLENLLPIVTLNEVTYTQSKINIDFKEFDISHKKKKEKIYYYTLPVLPIPENDNDISLILEILKEHEALEEYSRLKKIYSRKMSEKEFLTIVGELTQKLEGKIFRSHTDFSEIKAGDTCQLIPQANNALSYILRGMIMKSDDYTKLDDFQFVMNTSTRIVRKLSSPFLDYVLEFARISGAIEISTKSWYGKKIIIKDDPQIIEALADFYVHLAEHDIFFLKQKYLARLLKDSKDEEVNVENVKAKLDELASFIIHMERIEKGITAKALDCLFEWLDKVTSFDNLKIQKEMIFKYIQTISKNGEMYLGDIIWSLDLSKLGRTITEIFTTGGSVKEAQDKQTELLEKMHAIYREYGIVNMARIYYKGELDQFNFLNELFKNRKKKHRDNYRLAVVIVAREGRYKFASDTFAINLGRKLKDLTNAYKLLIYSINSEQGLAEVMQSALALSSRKKIDLLMIAGHGQQHMTNFGYDALNKRIIGLNRSIGIEEAIWDVNDRAIFKEIEKYVAGNSKVILFSCLTGKGRSSEVNMANTMAFYLPERLIYAPDESFSGEGALSFILDNLGFVEDVIFFSGDKKPVYTYRVKYSKNPS